MTDVVAEANELVRAGRTADGIALLDTGCARNHRDALFERAVWYLTGKAGGRDLSAAKVFLGRAAAVGHADAALMEIAMTANGSGGEPDWPMAMVKLRNAAAGDPQAALQLALVERMPLDASGSPTQNLQAETISADPLVARVAGFLSPEECSYLAHLGNSLLTPATVVDPATGRLIEHPIRTSHAGSIGPLREDLVARAINRRVAAVSRTDVAQGEPLMILRYMPGQQYRLHSDAIAGTTNQRIRTVLLYLSDDYAGGETEFPDLRIRFRGKPGDALIFDNVGDDGRPHPLARHAGLPVTSGVKWLATRWIRAHRFDPWNPI